MTIGVLIVAVILAIGAAWIDNDQMDEPRKDEETRQQTGKDPEASEYNFPPVRADDLLQEQKELEARILDESEGSTLEHPYVNLDPYNRSPLAALVIFDTEENARITFTVKGKDDETNISKTMPEYKTHHELPITGLYPDYENQVEITAETESGEILKHTLTISTEPLPEEMPTIDIKTADKEKMKIMENELTFYIPSTRYAFGFDINGDVRWYGSGFNSHILQELENGNILFLGKDDNSGSAYNRLF